MSNDLPPGCSVNDIPGNTPEDARFESVCEQLTELWQTNLSQFRVRLTNDGMELLAKWIIEREETIYQDGYDEGFGHGALGEDL